MIVARWKNTPAPERAEYRWLVCQKNEIGDWRWLNGGWDSQNGTLLWTRKFSTAEVYKDEDAAAALLRLEDEGVVGATTMVMTPELTLAWMGDQYR